MFKSNLKLNLEVLLCSNPLLTVIIGDFNAKSKDWCPNDITIFEGSEHDFLTAQFELSQIINSHILKHKPTHILHNSRSFIHLIFTSQPNMVIDSGLHAFLQLSPPNYIRKVWFKDIFSATIWEDCVALQACELWSYQKGNWHLWLGTRSKLCWCWWSSSCFQFKNFWMFFQIYC